MQFSQSLSQTALHFQGRYYPLNKPQFIIGSDPICDIRVENNPRVLPMHAQVISQGGQVFLQYMERSAAIWVNGVPAAQKVLQDQDEIALGDGETRLTLLLNWNPSGASPAATWTDPSSTLIQANKQASAPQAAQRTGGQRVLQPIPTTRPEVAPSAAPAQMPPTMVAAPAFGAAPGYGMAPPQTPQIGAFAPAYQQQAPMGTPNTLGSNTTRYLCAAGHLDEGFQDYVLRHIIHEERRALGESYGVDMLAVVSWCKAGLRRINTRDAILGILFLVIFAIIGVRIIQEVSYVVQQVNLMNQYDAQYGYSVSPQLILSLLLISGLALPLGAIIVLLIALGVEIAIKGRWRNSHPGIVSLITLTILLGQFIPFNLSFLITLALWATIFVELILRYYGNPTNHLRKGAFNPQIRPVELDANLEHRLRASFSTERRNVIAYSGYRPFAGAGYYHGGWSFVVDTSKGAPDPSDPDKRLKPQAFTVSSLYGMVEKDVQTLGINDVLEVEGKLYVNGQFLPENPPFFNTADLRPVTNVDARLLEQYKEHPTEDVRYYQCLRFNFWRGEMIFTTFLRFIQRGKDLFTEVDYMLLPPMKDDYYWVDRKELTPTISKIWQLFKRSFDAPILTWFSVPARLLRVPIYTARQQKLARIARNNPAFDYGAATSLRWEASDDSYHLFFQRLDKEMYLKIIEMQILETIVTFLDARQIDTTELRERQQMILNNNTYVSGQSINIGAMATGQGGQATNTPAPAPAGAQAKSHP